MNRRFAIASVVVALFCGCGIAPPPDPGPGTGSGADPGSGSTTSGPTGGDGAPDDQPCFSPDDLDSLFVVGATGCACDPSVDSDVCTGIDTVGLTCDNSGAWTVFSGGPCTPPPPPCFSPTQNTDLAASGAAAGCPCDPDTDDDACIDDLGLVCDFGLWSVDDSACI
jgi:hypothetical protein